jgi:hypothetical protein
MRRCEPVGAGGAGRSDSRWRTDVAGPRVRKAQPRIVDGGPFAVAMVDIDVVGGTGSVRNHQRDAANRKI